MAKKNRYGYKPQKPRSRNAPEMSPVMTAEMHSKKVEVEYGKPFVLLEDMDKNTFEYKGGAWVPHPRTIAQCRLDCQIKELSQKVNKMTRYEVRCPV